MKRFVILGLPRSGSTYLMTLLGAHRDVFCSGEQFNPYAVIGIGAQDDSHEAVLRRDKDPVGHMNAFFAAEKVRGTACAGFKFMIGHNIRLLEELGRRSDIAIIHVWRDNRLAQASSLMKAAKTRNWAQTRRDAHVHQKIHATPRQISHRWHEYATFDHLVTIWLASLPHHRMAVEYREMFKPGFEQEICAFLGIRPHAGMKSPLVKQGSNAILDRFSQPAPLRYYFTQLGLEHWLGEEL
ncbi:sulfotransferase [Roseovarius aquimarinus]|uniref:Sulfotransferase n=1 Tax=Roseovarius aquimarinus TaxID=1229156 RepID=A0ABW7IAE4_9RHOB